MTLILPILVWLPSCILVAAMIYLSRVDTAHSKPSEPASTTTRNAAGSHHRDRLDTVLQLNRELVEARDEKSLVEAALSAVNRLVDGLGVSYVPFDAWGQPLPAFYLWRAA